MNPNDAGYIANEDRAGQQININDSHQTTPELMANLSIKVTRRQRLHWLIEAKKQGTSLTAAITEAMNNRFGIPE